MGKTQKEEMTRAKFQIIVLMLATDDELRKLVKTLLNFYS